MQNGTSRNMTNMLNIKYNTEFAENRQITKYVHVCVAFDRNNE